MHTYINVYTFINVSMHIHIHAGAKWVCLTRYLVVSKAHVMHCLSVYYVCIYAYIYKCIHIYKCINVYSHTYRRKVGVPHALSRRIESARDALFICILCMYICIHI